MPITMRRRIGLGVATLVLSAPICYGLTRPSLPKGHRLDRLTNLCGPKYGRLWLTAHTSHCSPLETHKSVRIDKLSMEDVSETARVIDKAFPLSAPHSWGRALGFTSGMEDYMHSYLPKPIGLKDLASLAARVGRDGKDEIVGVLILENMDSPYATKPSKTDTDSPTSDSPEDEVPEEFVFAIQAIEAILDECKSIFKSEYKKRHEESPALYRTDSRFGYVAWIAVDDSMRGKDIAGSLIEKGMRNLRENGVSYAVAFCVSPTATRVFQRRGFEVWGSVRYADFEFGGKQPFAILPDECSVLVKKLD
jgi:GNAT superfamily N-acetyltransferase